ncbi:MAG: GGDEF domain-containing protein [Planctomycetota bacterium]
MPLSTAAERPPTHLIEDHEALALRLEEAADWVRGVATGHPTDTVAGPLRRSLAEMQAVWTALRAYAVLFNPERVEAQARGERELQRALAIAADSTLSLRAASDRAEAAMDDQLAELERARQAEEPEAMAEGVRRVAREVHEATTRLRGALDHADERLEASRLGVRSVAAEVDAAREHAVTSALSNALSREVFLQRLEETLGQAGLYRGHVCFGVMEIDQLARVEGELGRAAADVLVVRVAEIAHARMATQDSFLGVLDGGKLGLLLTGCSLSKGRNLAEATASVVAGSRWECSTEGRSLIVSLTASIGLTQPRGGEDADAVMRRALSLVGAARSKGGNCVVAGRTEAPATSRPVGDPHA